MPSQTRPSEPRFFKGRKMYQNKHQRIPSPSLSLSLTQWKTKSGTKKNCHFSWEWANPNSCPFDNFVTHMGASNLIWILQILSRLWAGSIFLMFFCLPLWIFHENASLLLNLKPLGMIRRRKRRGGDELLWVLFKCENRWWDRERESIEERQGEKTWGKSCLFSR